MMPGMNPSLMPSIRCLPTSPHMSVHDSFGSTPMTAQAGFTARNAWPTPMSVPPVPTPAIDRARHDPVGELREDLGSEPLAVLVDVPLVVELVRAEVARLVAELARLLERLGHVEVADASGPRRRTPG